MKKKINEQALRKDSTVNKIQFDKEWFYAVKDMEDYLDEDLTGIECITLPMTIDGFRYNVKCSTWEDITRFLQKEPLEDFKGSVLKDKKLLSKTLKTNKKT
ncbi:hypothetical protein GR160_04870 [Flavobacterium sp. Sd200]|uniref:hypothetical protein n=1 Tax=Flavobacterium sp. Sd200 TaxID=2692211 RepID=UPI00136A9AE2|nr:hypothetical protein [Flavobacterium sp. Sd200]MXN90549.1 hypothetical protein [Flavobacterium sp. Sd200]